MLMGIAALNLRGPPHAAGLNKSVYLAARSLTPKKTNASLPMQRLLGIQRCQLIEKKPFLDVTADLHRRRHATVVYGPCLTHHNKVTEPLVSLKPSIQLLQGVQQLSRYVFPSLLAGGR